jgi:hypothetical protein
MEPLLQFSIVSCNKGKLLSQAYNFIISSMLYAHCARKYKEAEIDTRKYIGDMPVRQRGGRKMRLDY